MKVSDYFTYKHTQRFMIAYHDPLIPWIDMVTLFDEDKYMTIGKLYIREYGFRADMALNAKNPYIDQRFTRKMQVMRQRMKNQIYKVFPHESLVPIRWTLIDQIDDLQKNNYTVVKMTPLIYRILAPEKKYDFIFQ